jgi:hypothetical protein
MSLVRDVFRAAYRRDPAALQLADLTLTVMANYRQHIDAGMTDGDPDDAGLVPLVNHDNGFYLRWSTGSMNAVVFLGSEGQSQIAARSEEEFVSLVVYGHLIDDAMKYWRRRLTPPYEVFSQLEPTNADLELCRSATRPRDAWKPHVIAVASAAGISVEPDPFACVGAANKALLEDFVALARRRFKPDR